MLQVARRFRAVPGWSREPDTETGSSPDGTHKGPRSAYVQDTALVTLYAMPIEIDIAHVAKLARLGLAPGELDRYGSQLEVILEHAAKVQAMDTTGVEPTAHPLGMTNAFRPDVVRPSLERDEILASAPDATDTHFRVPPALEQE